MHSRFSMFPSATKVKRMNESWNAHLVSKELTWSAKAKCDVHGIDFMRLVLTKRKTPFSNETFNLTVSAKEFKHSCLRQVVPPTSLKFISY